ncbi:OLC1v1015055C2 [Oldenlandia corymbosa var. corymbosa]|uniref:OLC1v1015055C2 n=1 Tax=Oldenlandia corymbosa var. corymbosa TaxID=529605 RepID=A0AAV1E4I3_OLDCO|nr:OLC1v1015055C2 [Oldenlandia corymbosa var. corymbosa]
MLFQEGTYPLSTTTEGIWLARCIGIQPFTLVMDLEGTDGLDHGEEEPVLLKQIATFAVAVSDIVLLNVWCCDLGRENATNNNILRTVLQAMMQRLFDPRSTTLMFVIRDKTRTPLGNLESIIHKDIQRIWDSIPKSRDLHSTSIYELFTVEVVALSSYDYKEEDFNKEVDDLRDRFVNSIEPGRLAGRRKALAAASEFPSAAVQIWNEIKGYKGFDLPSYKVLNSTVRCHDIADSKYDSFQKNEEWRGIQEIAQSHPVPNFGKKLSTIIKTCLTEYDAETTYFDEAVRMRIRKQLEEKLLKLVQPTHRSILGRIGCDALERFKESFDAALNGGKKLALVAPLYSKDFMKQFDGACADAAIDNANWGTSVVRDSLQCGINLYVETVGVGKVSELKTVYEIKLKAALAEPVKGLLLEDRADPWLAIRKLLKTETRAAADGF